VSEVRGTGSQRLPLATIALALVAMGSLYVTSKGYPGLIVLSVALVGTLATGQRLPASPLLAWAIRVVVFGTLLVTANPDKRLDAGSLLFEPGYTNLFGFLCAAELVIRAWVRRRGGPSKGEMILLSTLVFAAATNAGDLRSVWWVRTLAPVYLILVVMTLRAFRERPRAWSVGWVAATGVALAVGGGSSWAVAEFEGKITRWTMRYLAGKRTVSSIGLSRTATLGRVFNPHPSPKRVMKIEGWPGERHVRASSFDQYSDGTWGPPVDQREFGAMREVSQKGEGREVTFTRYGEAFGLVCAPLETLGITPEDQSVALQQDVGGAIRTEVGQAPDPFVYRLSVGREGVQGIVARPLTDEERKWNLVVPAAVDPGVHELAKRVAGTGDDRVRVARIHTYLRSNHKYSLQVDPGEGEPVSAFLLTKMDGHCVYFASSVAVMARCAGIPARYVSGYFAHEGAGDGVTVVRERDAHAWAECWVEGTGWVTVDATPSGGRPDALFTETPAWRRWWEQAQDRVAAVRAWLGRRTLIEGAVMIAALAAVPVFIRVWKGREAGRKRRAAESYGPGSRELAEVGRRFERAMRKRGVVIAGNRTWAESVAGVEGGREFVAAYNAVRFGGEGSVDGLRNMVERLEA
jgi:transglutaminase-like putative cysteine protease